MTYLDASVVVAILGREDDRAHWLRWLAAAEAPLIVSPPGLFEAVVSLASKKARDTGVKVNALLIEQAEASVRSFLAEIDAQEVDITPAIGRGAIEAARRWGRAAGSPAALNFGDCLAYACAKQHGAALLYKGEDFAQTDLG